CRFRAADRAAMAHRRLSSRYRRPVTVDLYFCAGRRAARRKEIMDSTSPGRTSASPLLASIAIGEAGVAEAGPDREHAPVLDVLHEGDFAQSLHDRVIVHEHGGVVLADRRDLLDQECRQVEVLALPVARQVLGAALDGAVLVDLAGAADADEGCELNAVP